MVVTFMYNLIFIEINIISPYSKSKVFSNSMKNKALRIETCKENLLCFFFPMCSKNLHV
jgi:hypothetical protein